MQFIPIFDLKIYRTIQHFGKNLINRYQMQIQKIERIEEVWKLIEGFSNYDVSNTGQIKSKDRKTWHKGSKNWMNVKGKVMKQRWNKSCKCFFLDLINDDGKRCTAYPHREVAKAFCINVLPEEFTMVIHIDNDSKNNDSTNLEWVNTSEHMSFQFKVGNKDNHKVWKIRKKKYKNGFKPDTVFKGRPKKEDSNIACVNNITTLEEERFNIIK